MIATRQMLKQQLATETSGRILVLVDLENLAGTADFTEAEAARIYDAYTEVAPHGEVDHFVVATSHDAAPAAWFGWPASARRLIRSGQDGADLALLDILGRENVASRYDRVVISSGDGIFALEAARLQQVGVGVTVVTRRGALSKRLQLAVRDVRYIDLPAARTRAAIAQVAR